MCFQANFSNVNRTSFACAVQQLKDILENAPQDASSLGDAADDLAAGLIKPGVLDHQDKVRGTLDSMGYISCHCLVHSIVQQDNLVVTRIHVHIHVDDVQSMLCLHLAKIPWFHSMVCRMVAHLGSSPTVCGLYVPLNEVIQHVMHTANAVLETSNYIMQLGHGLEVLHGDSTMPW